MRQHGFAFKAMGSPCELRLWAATRGEAERVAQIGMAEVARLEHKYSRYRDESLASAINASAGDPEGIEVDAETAGLLDYAAVAHAQSGGLFDATSGILRRVWDFEAKRLPEPDALRELLGRIGWQRVSWQRPRLVLPLPGMELDFGGFVKEYAADRVAERCRAEGLRHGLVDLGGDLAVIGPHPDGSPWRVGIRHPRFPGQAMACVPLRHGGLASSGDYERCMIVDGVRYGHILDPRSGWPVRGLQAASVVAPRCLIAGTASTVAMLKGERDGPRWLAGLGLPAVFVRSDGSLGSAVGSALDAVREAA